MQRLPGFDHDEVGDIDHVVDRFDAIGMQIVGQPFRRRAHLHVIDNLAQECRTFFRLAGNFEGIRRTDLTGGLCSLARSPCGAAPRRLPSPDSTSRCSLPGLASNRYPESYRPIPGIPEPGFHPPALRHQKT